MATHSSVLAWKIPGTVEPDGLPSMGAHRVGHNWRDLAAAAAAISRWRNKSLPWLEGWERSRCGCSWGRMQGYGKIKKLYIQLFYVMSQIFKGFTSASPFCPVHRIIGTILDSLYMPVGEREGGVIWEKSITLPYIKYISIVSLIYEARHPKPVLCENLEKCPGEGRGWGVRDAEDTSMGRQFILMHGKPSWYCKVIILQLKFKK